MSEIELKPCPFCGDVKPLVMGPTCTRKSEYDPADRAFPVARCQTCGAEVPGHDWDESRKSAIAAWNTRSQSERVSRLEEALKPFAKLRIREAAWPDDYQVQVYMPVGAESGLTLRDFRRARSALNQGADDGQ